MRIFHKLINTHQLQLLRAGPFTATIQTRFKKPANTAQTRLETRTCDPKLDLLAFHHRRLSLVLSLYNLVSQKKRGPFLSIQLLSRWAPYAGLNTLSAGEFLRKYPHVFEVFTHPVKRNACCKFTSKFVDLVKQEDEIVREMENVNLTKIKKILMLSVNGRVHLHAIRLMRRELGLPENFRDSIIKKYSEIFRMVDLEIVELVNRNENEERLCFSAEVEKWRDREYKSKWLSEFETKYAFPINFPTGFKIVRGLREKLKNWQRLSYLKPYERMEKVQRRTCGGVEKYEKRAVGIIHELLCLMVEKMVEVERLAHFRKDLGIVVNLREVLLKHPGIFYISTRGSSQFVFLREAYCKGCLVELDMVYGVRRKMLDLLLLGCRHTRELREEGKGEEERLDVVIDENRGERRGGPQDGDFVIEFLEGCYRINGDCDRDLSNIELHGLHEKEVSYADD